MLLDANIFQPLIDVFATVIKFFHSSVGFSWGLSIVALTICVRLVLLPIAWKQYQSMKAMQQHMPQMKALQQRYKGDRQRLAQEQQKFYKENNVNPLASCLPMVLQLPVFVSLYYMLRQNLRSDICPAKQTAFQKAYAHTHGISLSAAAGQTTQCGNVHGAGFLFIHDITNQATGWVLIVLCVIYVGTQMTSTLLMSAPTMDKTQRRMMTVLPIFFVLFIIRFPAGLLVYWITTNTWTMVQQYSLKKIAGAPIIPEVIDDDPGGSSSGKSSNNRRNERLTGSVSGSSTTSSGGTGRLASLFTPKANQDARSSNGTGTSSAPGSKRPSGQPATPPRPPRKRKKRSGRRR